MLRIQFLLLLLLPFLAFGQEKDLIIQEQLPKVPPKNLDLYLVIGQSNMAGRATIRETEKKPLERVFLLTESTTEPWVVATNPLNRHSTIRKNRGMQRLSPAYAFAKTMATTNPDKEIGLIVNAKGGTKIVQWLPTTHFFKEVVQRTKAAMKYGTLKGIIWHQGESDCDSLRTSLYLGRLEILINGFREAFNQPDLPFIAGEVTNNTPNRVAFNKNLNYLPKFIKHTALVSTAGTALRDDVHFDSKSAILLGERYAKAVLTLSTKTQGPYFGNGVHNGWVDQHSITIWTRLTEKSEMNWQGKPFIPLSKKQADKLAELKNVELLHRNQIPAGLTLKDMEGACPGAAGEVQLTYYELGNPNNKKQLDWVKVDVTKNFTTQWKLTNLSPDTKYVLALSSRSGKGQAIGDQIKGEFVTPPLKEQQKDINFSIASCHDYIRKDAPKGHKIYAAMEQDNLDFFVHTGDIEYYDKANPWAMTEPMMYFKWNRLFALPLQRNFYKNTSSYFMKDDHDVLRDDAYPGTFYGPISFERGLEIFDKEQFPSHDTRYKTIRWGKDLQIWLLEGRNYRSKNTDEDGPGKTILGKKQKQWLFNTLKESDASFKVIISSSPIIGPDRPKGKNDNYSNKAFAYEGTEIRDYLNQFDNVFVCNGDRHWQYVSHLEGTNLWEFGCGAGADAHAGGWKQDNVQPEHQFLRVKGGYLVGKVSSKGGSTSIKFQHRDVDGNVVNEVIFPKKD